MVNDIEAADMHGRHVEHHQEGASTYQDWLYILCVSFMILIRSRHHLTDSLRRSRTQEEM